MKRDHPDVLVLEAEASLPAPPAAIIDALRNLITQERWQRMQAVVAQRTRSLVPVLEDLADPHNGAAILRSADAFGCHEVHVVQARHAFAVSHRVSRGTHRWLELHRHEQTASCLASLKARGHACFVASMEGELTPEDLARVPKAAIVFGNEHRGISETAYELADGTYRVPMVGFVESLNVSVASAITLYVASRGRHGDLDAEAREVILARYLLASVRDAERIVRERAT